MNPNNNRPADLFELHAWLHAGAGRLESFLSDDAVSEYYKELMANCFGRCSTERTRILNSTNEKQILIYMNHWGPVEMAVFSPSTGSSPHFRITNCEPYMSRVYSMMTDRMELLATNPTDGVQSDKHTGALALACVKAYHDALPSEQQIRYVEDLFFEGMSFETDNMETAYLMVDAMLLASPEYVKFRIIPTHLLI